MKDCDKDAIRCSREGLSDINHLKAQPEFNRFMARLQEMADQWATDVLGGSMPSEDREELRVKRLGLLVALRLPEEAILGHTKVLERFGIRPGDEVPTS